MGRRVVHALAYAVWILPLGACSARAPAEAQDQPVTEASYPERFAQAWCATLGACCEAASVTFTDDRCEERVETHLRFEATSNARFALAFDAANAERCITGVTALGATCDDIITEELESCLWVYVGTLAAGEPCNLGEECAGFETGLAECNDDSGPALCAARQPQRRAALGEECAQTCSGAVCNDRVGTSAGACLVDDGLYCDVDAGVCTAPPGVGEVCHDFCANGAYCSDFTCVAQIASGSCAESGDVCLPEAYCETATKQCLPKGEDGTACEYGSSCLSGHCNDGICGPDTIVSQGACAGDQ